MGGSPQRDGGTGSPNEPFTADDIDIDARPGRRDVLTGLGAASIAGLAGCFHSPGGVDQSTLRVGVAQTFSQPAWNVFNPTKDQIRVATWMFLRPIYYLTHYEEWTPGLIQEWEFEDQTATFTLDDRFSWHTGEDVTARDLVVHYGIEAHFGHPAFQSIERQEAVDDTTWRLDFSNPVNRRLMMLSLFAGRTALQSPRMVFGDYYDGLQAGNSSAEEELLQFRWEEPIGTGPWQFDEYLGPSEMEAVKFEDYPLADQIDIPRVLFRVASDEQQRELDMMNDRVDVMWSAPTGVAERVTQQKPNWEGRTADRYLSTGGRAWTFNCSHEWWGDPHARRGLAFLWNEHEIHQGSPSRGTVPKEPETLLTDSWVDQYLDGVELEDFGPDASLEDRAEEEFEMAGWERQNGTWHDENDEEVLFHIRTGAHHTDMMDRIEIITQMNEDFGLSSEMEAMEGEAYWARWREGDFDVCWSGVSGAHPFQHYQTVILGSAGEEQFQYPREVDVPPVGDVGGEATETFQLDELALALQSAQTDEEERDAIQKLAWICNQTVPARRSFQRTPGIGQLVNTANWNWPPDGDRGWSVGDSESYQTIMGNVTPK